MRLYHIHIPLASAMPPSFSHPKVQKAHRGVACPARVVQVAWGCVFLEGRGKRVTMKLDKSWGYTGIHHLPTGAGFRPYGDDCGIFLIG